MPTPPTADPTSEPPAHTPSGAERLIENTLYASRWLLAPLYLGLAGTLFLLVLKFFFELFHAAHEVLHLDGAETVLVLLEFIDLALVGGLIVMVMLSGFENFVSRLDVTSGEKLGWLGKLDAGSLKRKVAGSIIAISSIHLLRAFMHVEGQDKDNLMWMVIIHLTFVLSALGVVMVDRLGKR